MVISPFSIFLLNLDSTEYVKSKWGCISKFWSRWQNEGEKAALFQVNATGLEPIPA